MNKLHRTLLLTGLRAQCRADREQDWQSLHRRDRGWFRQQSTGDRWELMRSWLARFGDTPGWWPGLSPLALVLGGLVAGAGLMSGLLQFQPLQRINVWWWLLLAVWLPTLWWLAALWLNRSAANRTWSRVLRGRLPAPWLPALGNELLGLAARVVSQQLSTGFALGMLGAFLLHLLLTDLAFGWSSTLNLGADSVHRMTRMLSLPWQAFWPQAVPSLELVEQSRFFRTGTAPPLGEAAQLGDWWRFLLMNLLCYVVLPRGLVHAWSEWRLARAQARLFEQDPCINGWWQRLHVDELALHAEPAPRNRMPDPVPENTAQDPVLPVLDGIVIAGTWDPDRLAATIAGLPGRMPALPVATGAPGTAVADPGRSFLLLCKGWEPPTGTLADLCRAFHERDQALYLWPAPLPGMQADRVERLRRSWQLFMPELPPSCHLLNPAP